MLRFVEGIPVTRSKGLACATIKYSCRCAGLFELHLTAFVLAGLDGGVKLLKGIADKYEDVTYADIFQLASAIAVKVLLPLTHQRQNRVDMTPLLARFDLVCFCWGCSLFMSGDLQDAGGPSIPLRMGRKDAPGPESQQPEGNLPGTGPHNVICGLHGLLIGSRCHSRQSTVRCSGSSVRCGCAPAVYTLEAISHLPVLGRIQSLVHEAL